MLSDDDVAMYRFRDRITWVRVRVEGLFRVEGEVKCEVIWRLTGKGRSRDPNLPPLPSQDTSEFAPPALSGHFGSNLPPLPSQH